jgi:hypothetical protein
VRFFVNGIVVSSGSASTNIASTTYAIGRRYPNWDSAYPTGYISDARVVNGTALYTSNFVPPTAPATAVQNTTLLLNGTSAGVLDGSAMANFETVGGAQISTSIKKYSTGSIYFDGSGDGLFLPTNLNLALGSGNFTVEIWVYPTVSAVQGIVGFGNGATVQPYLYLDGLTPRFLWNSTNVAAGPALTQNAWNHLAVTRSGSTVRIFTNGTSGTAASPYTDAFTTAGVYVGVSSAATQYFTGYLDDLRITRGAARYTTTFTPPASVLRGK